MLDQKLDTSGYLHVNNQEAQRAVLAIKEELDLIDVWRATHPDSTRFTWRNTSPNLKQSRLDFCLISQDLYSQTSSALISAGYKTDHSLIQININPSNIKHGKSFWKCNTQLLHDKDYVCKAKETILETARQYAKPGQSIDMPLTDIELTIGDQLFWEMLKMEIRKMSISYNSRKKRDRQKEEKQIIYDINNLEDNLSKNPSIQIKKELETKKAALEGIRENALKATLIRSRA